MADDIALPHGPIRDATCQPNAVLRQRRRWLRWLICTSALLLVLGFVGRDVMRHASDVPALAELLAEARTVHASTGTFGASPAHDHAPLVSLAKSAFVRLNGQIDARLSVFLGLVLQVGSFGLLLLLLGRRTTLRQQAVFGLALVCLVVTPMAWSTIAPRTLDGVTIALFFSLAHLALLSDARSGSRCWWIGCAVGILGVFAASAAIASAVALFTAAAVRFSRGRQRSADTVREFVGSTLVLAVGVGIVLGRGVAPATAGWALAAWPFEQRWQAWIVWIPTLFCVGTVLYRGRAASTAFRLLPLAIWAACLVTMCSLTGAGLPSCTPVLCAALLTNAVLWRALRPVSSATRTGLFILAAAWAILVTGALLQPSPIPERDPDHENAVAAALAAEVRGDASRPGDSQLTALERRQCAEIAHDTGLRSILPVSVRAPLPLLAPPDGSASAFRAEASPVLPERESLPIIGTWSAAGPHRNGEFVSAPVRATLPILQLRIAGALQPPTTSIVLRTSLGETIPPLTGPITGRDRWRRVNFTAPAGPFQIVARSSSTDEWLALTAPVEIGPLTRLAAKVSPGWPAIALGIGSLLALVAAWPLLRRSATVLRRVPWQAVPWVALLGYAVFFSYRTDPTAGPNDSGGYLNSAKLLASGSTTGTARPVFGVAAGETDITPYVPITFHADRDRLVPEYPVGWPLELALAGKLFGFATGVPILIVAQLLLGVWMTQRLAREFGLRHGWDWLAGGIVALSPVYLFEGLQPVSDGPAMLFVTLAVYWAWLSRERIGYAALAGAATALAVMIRPSNLLTVVPLLVCLGLQWRRLLLWGVCGVPGAAWLAWYQHRLYGSWLTTGYGDVASGFGLRFLAPTLHSYAQWLPELLSPVVLLGLVLPFAKPVSIRLRWLLATWVLSFAAFYAVYWCTWDNWYNMRFLLPAFPAMIIAALLVLQWLVGETNRARIAAATALLVAMIVFVGARTGMREVPFWMKSNHKPAEAAVWAREHLPRNAVVFAKHMTGSLFFYTDLTFVRLDHPLAKDLQWHARVASTGRPIYAITCHWETPGYRWETGRGSGYPGLPGSWERVTSLGDGEILVWRQAKQ